MNDYRTIGELAQASGLSRSTLLYYDRLGLLRPGGRSDGNYRLYSRADEDRLQQICLYRRMGIPLKEIAHLLDHVGPDSPRAGQILQERLQTLELEMQRLRRQQEQIVRLLETLYPEHVLPKEAEMVTKDRWVEIMKAAGFCDEDMKNWHRQFEKLEPDAHREFLESLGIEAAEISRIREWSRA